VIPDHVRRLWPRYPLAPVLPFWAWAIFCALRGELRWDHIALVVLATSLAYGHAKTKRVFLGLLPMGLVALFYDSMRLFKNAGLSETSVHLCDLRAAEAHWFGFVQDGVPATVHDWLQRHATLPLDVFGAVAYVVLAYALFLSVRDFAAGQRFMWGFFVLNMVGFATYHIYPAAPPWYYHSRGCVVDLTAHASAGPNLTRVDELLGIKYFAGFYGRSNDVFGAVPSLHVAYPLLMVLEGWSKHRRLGRTLLIGFYLWMCFSAVYLDHHWIIDVVLGSVYTVVTGAVMRLLERWLEARGSRNRGLAPVTHQHELESRWQI